jgi:uncharacterized protein (TIGR03437 family)
VTKLRPDTLESVYSARLSGECQSRPGPLRIGPAGEVTISVWAFIDLQNRRAGFPVRNPVLPIPNCYGYGVGAVSRLSADGSALLFSSYLDQCGEAPPLALSPDSSVYVGATGINQNQLVRAGVLRIPVAQPERISVESAANAFSGTLVYAVPGMLLTIGGQRLAPTFMDLGLIDPGLGRAVPPAPRTRGPRLPPNLPTALGGVQVLFDGVPAKLLQVGPNRLICVVPDEVRDRASVTVQVISGAQRATPFVLPVLDWSNLGLLTHSFPNLPPPGLVDGNIRNADGTVNNAEHPAAPGSTVTLFATGLTGPGPVSLFWNAPSPQSSYDFSPPLAATARRIPSSIDAIYAVDFRIPDSPGEGVYLVPRPGVLTRAVIGRGGTGIAVYVK